jgi:uncharacterized protein
MNFFALGSALAWLVVVVAARLVRNGSFATFVGVLVGVYSQTAIALAPAFAAVLPVFVALHASVYVNFLFLSRPRMRSLPYRLVVSWPAAFFAAGTLLGLPWAVAMALGFHPWAPWLPYLLAAVWMVQSLSTKREVIDLSLAPKGGVHPSAVTQHGRGDTREARPLRIVQISDPHLGPFMSVARLRAIAERAVAAKPDLVFLTGDFLTMESHSDADLLLRAMEPLAAMPGRVFACNGNHDHEAPEVVARAMRENGIHLLVDESVLLSTEAGPVQVVGMDFVWGDRSAHLAKVTSAHPRVAGATRIVLLHDPGAFKHLPEGEGDLVLAGHTHGGQVGLVSVGLSWTFLRLFGVRLPDHGYWARGRDRMWVHRGTGHYGFPLRLGVPAEESVLQLHRATESVPR